MINRNLSILKELKKHLLSKKAVEFMASFGLTKYQEIFTYLLMHLEIL